MIIYLENNHQIAGNDLLSVILRYDLVPIPVTLEVTVNATNELKTQLAEGKLLTLGNGLTLKIVKSQNFDTQTIKDGHRIGSMAIIAVLAGCEPLLNATKKAVSLQSVSFSEIYRSLGAKVKIGNDIKVNSFICLKGQIPTKRIALALQKEGCVVVYNAEKKAIEIKRLQDLLSQSPSGVYDPSAVQWIENKQAITRQNTNYLSVDSNGSDIVGQVNDNKSVDYMPRCDTRELHNLKRILMTCGVMSRTLDSQLMAGNVISVGDKKLAILTTAISLDTGSMGGSSAIASKIWLAKMVDS